MPRPGPLRRAGDQAGQVGDDEGLGERAFGHHAELGDEGGERVVGDLRPRRRDDADKGRLAGVGKADHADVGEQLELQAEAPLAAILAGIGAAGRLVGRGGEASVASPSPAAGRDEQTLAVGEDLAEHLAALLVVDDGAERHRDLEVLALPAGLVGALAVPPALGRVERGEAEVVEGVAVGEADEVDRSPVPSVAAGGAAAGDVLLAAERHDAVATPPGADVDSGFVEENQGGFGEVGRNVARSRTDSPGSGRKSTRPRRWSRPSRSRWGSRRAAGCG